MPTPLTETMRLILYGRFSPRPPPTKCPKCGSARIDNTDTGFKCADCEHAFFDCESCESQLADLRRWAEAGGHEIVGEFSDHALSGAHAKPTYTAEANSKLTMIHDFDGRPGMLDALNATKRGMVFVVRAFDRLFRDLDAARAFKAMLAFKGAKLLSLTESSACDDSPMGEAMQQFIFILAELNRKLINARTSARMRQHQANGRKMGGHPPFGKRCDGKRLVDNQYELLIAERVLVLRAGGYGLRAICRQLHRENWRPRGKRWRPETIRRILRRLADGARS